MDKVGQDSQHGTSGHHGAGHYLSMPPPNVFRKWTEPGVASAWPLEIKWLYKFLKIALAVSATTAQGSSFND